MNKQTRDNMESMAEWASTMDAYDRLLERRNRPWRRTLRFVLNWRQVVDGPEVPVPASGAQAQSHTCAPAPPDAGTRAAGSEAARPPLAHNPPKAVSGSRIPGGPTHYPSSEASRISAALNRHT